MTRARVTGQSSYRLPIPDDLKQRAIEHANRTGVSLAKLIRTALDEYIGRHGR